MAKTPQQATQQISLSQQALDYLGLEQQPFTPSILPPESVYNHAGLTQLKDTIKHHLQFSDLLLVIEGNFGSGKTTFFRQLMQEEIPNVFLMPQQAEATDTLTQIQQKMSIHLREQGDASHLDDNLKNMQVFDQTPVLMIDDAHMLSDTTLQELIRYRQQLLVEKELSLKILLFANKGMAATIKHVSDLEQSEMFVQDLPALNSKQIQTFVHHRLASAGASNPPPFDEKTVLAIDKRAAGNPLQIMAQAVSSIEKLANKSSRSGSASRPRTPLLIVLLVLITMAATAAAYFYLFSDDGEDSFSITPPETKQSPTPLPAGQPQVESTSPNTEIVMPAAEPEQPTTDSAAPDAEASVEVEEETSPPQITTPDSNLLPGMAPADPEMPAELLTPETTVTPQPPAPPKPKPAPTPPPPPVVKASPPPKVIRQPAADPALAQLTAMGLHDSQWLLSQDSSQWTLQILGARDPATLVKFARQHGLGNDTAWYVTDLKGKPWYVLVYRFYSQRDVARQAINQLPPELRKARPWAKSLAAIQKAIK